MASKRIVPVSTLRKLLSFDAETGRLRWRARSPNDFKVEWTPSRCAAWNKIYAGDFADKVIDRKGYRQTCVLDLRFFSHRIVWAMRNNAWPENFIDHINGVKSDNRVCNIRDVTHFVNMKNVVRATGKSGITGVSQIDGRWRAKCRCDNIEYHIGYFDTAQEAQIARNEWAKSRGFTLRHGPSSAMRANLPPTGP